MKHFIKILTMILICFVSNIIQAQDVIIKNDEKPLLNVAKNIVFAEFSAYPVIERINSIWGINYERLIFNSEKNRISLSGGIGTDFYWGGFSFPVNCNYIMGSKNNHLELGLGILPFFDSGNGLYTYYTATVGYRYQKPGKGFIFKLDMNLMFDYDDYSDEKISIDPRPGISIGYAF